MDLLTIAGGVYFLTQDNDEKKLLLKRQRELRNQQEEEPEYNTAYTIAIAIVVIFIIIYMIAIFYISWNCNTKGSPNMNGFEKSLRAFLAALFPNIYIILYSFFWQNKCKT